MSAVSISAEPLKWPVSAISISRLSVSDASTRPSTTSRGHEVIWPESRISRPAISFLLPAGASETTGALLGARSRLQLTLARPITGAVGLLNDAAPVPTAAGVGVIGVGRATAAPRGFGVLDAVSDTSWVEGAADSGFMSSSSFFRRNMLVILLYGRRDSLTRPSSHDVCWQPPPNGSQPDHLLLPRATPQLMS